MVFSVTFHNISVIPCTSLSVLLVEQIGVPGGNHRPVASHWQTVSQNVASSIIIIATHATFILFWCLFYSSFVMVIDNESRFPIMYGIMKVNPRLIIRLDFADYWLNRSKDSHWTLLFYYKCFLLLTVETWIDFIIFFLTIVVLYEIYKEYWKCLNTFDHYLSMDQVSVWPPSV